MGVSPGASYRHQPGKCPQHQRYKTPVQNDGTEKQCDVNNTVWISNPNNNKQTNIHLKDDLAKAVATPNATGVVQAGSMLVVPSGWVVHLKAEGRACGWLARLAPPSV